MVPSVEPPSIITCSKRYVWLFRLARQNLIVCAALRVAVIIETVGLFIVDF